MKKQVKKTISDFKHVEVKKTAQKTVKGGFIGQEDYIIT
jgi:hypothetical protein